MYYHCSPTTHVLSHLPLQEEAQEDASCYGSQSMDRLVELLNSMRSNSSGVEQQLASFMEEAQCSARSEETLVQVVDTIYSKAVSDRSFAATAAKLCDKMALFMVEGTKFRSLLLNMLQVKGDPQVHRCLRASSTISVIQCLYTASPTYLYDLSQNVCVGGGGVSLLSVSQPSIFSNTMVTVVFIRCAPWNRTHLEFLKVL